MKSRRDGRPIRANSTSGSIRRPRKPAFKARWRWLREARFSLGVGSVAGLALLETVRDPVDFHLDPFAFPLGEEKFLAPAGKVDDGVAAAAGVFEKGNP